MIMKSVDSILLFVCVLHVVLISLTIKSKSMKFNTKYNPPPSPKVAFQLPSMTRQEFLADADINNILKRYQETGFLVDPSRPSSLQPMFGDFSNVQDYQSALDALIVAQDNFMKLPARVRDRFNNDPGEFLKFVENPENADELVKMGLAKKPAAKPVEDKSPVVDKSANE